MLIDDSTVLTLTQGTSTTFAFPSTFDHIVEVVYTSSDGTVYDPNFADYTIVNNQITFPSTYDGTIDLYWQDNVPDTTPIEATGTWEFDGGVTLTLTEGIQTVYTLPTGYNQITSAVFISTDKTVFNPDFNDYTIVNGQITIPGNYNGSLDLYYDSNTPQTIVIDTNQWTLEQLYNKVVIDTGEDPSTMLDKDAQGNYVDQVSFVRVRNELNRAVRKIARKKFRPTFVDTVTLDNNLIFSVDNLTKSFFSIVSLTDADGGDIYFAKVSTSQFKASGNPSDQLQLTYEYIPADMVNLADIIDLPVGSVDPNIIIYWADYMWFSVDGNARKANAFLALWNDGFEDEIRQNTGETRTIKNVYSGGW